MTARLIVVGRKRAFHLTPNGFANLCKTNEPKSGHFMEYFVETLYLGNAVAQLAVCPGFYARNSGTYYENACWTFAMTAILTILLSAYQMYEVHAHHKRTTLIQMAGMGSTGRELTESIFYIIGSIMFAIGSIMFLPEVYEHSENSDMTFGTTMFFVGSVFFLMASWINGVNMPRPEGQPPSFKLGVLALGVSEAGAACFIAGSVLFYPQLEVNSCTAGPEWDPSDFGTTMYVAGSACFLLAAVLNYMTLIVKTIWSKDDEEAKHEEAKPAMECTEAIYPAGVPALANSPIGALAGVYDGSTSSSPRI